MKFTIKEYVEYLNKTVNHEAGETPFDYLLVSGMINFFVKCGVITDTGETKSVEGQRGKPSKIYEFPESQEVVFWEKPEPVAPEAVTV